MLLGAAVPIASTEAAEFIPVGDLPGGGTFSMALDLSADGSTVLGQSDSADGSQLFRWNLDSGFSIVPSFDPGPAFFPNFFATSISGDGSSVAGYAFTGTNLEGLKWDPINGFDCIGILDPAEGGSLMSVGMDISGDGNSVVGYGSAPSTTSIAALLWTSTMGLVSLEYLPADEPEPFYTSQSFAYGISDDGQTVVGASSSNKHVDRGEQAFRWTQGTGMQPLGFLTGEISSVAYAVSADGSVVAGQSGFSAFRWTAESGMEAIGNFTPASVSADGNVIVGTSPAEGLAVVWTPETGAQSLQSYLESKFNLSLPGWQSLTEAVAVSADGTVIAGTGINADGFAEAFIAKTDTAVETAGVVALTGSASLLIVDPAAQKYGIDPATGNFHNEIPNLTFTSEADTGTASWTDIQTGEHRVYVKGTIADDYSLDLSFLHADGNSSGANFSGDLLSGGLHVYAALISADTSEGAQYRLVYADTDGDKVEDGSDAVPRSDVRPTLFIGTTDTGLVNYVFPDGRSMNDIIKEVALTSKNHGEFVSRVNALGKQWIGAGILKPNAASAFELSIAKMSGLKLRPAKR